MITITTRTPLRISFVGGGTDLPAFYERHGGAVISTAIDKYVKVKVERYNKGISVAMYPEFHEVVYDVQDMSHSFARECLKTVGISNNISIEIESDIAPGSGLGGSSALTVGLIHALSVFKRKMEGREFSVMPKEYLARKACEVEIKRLGSPIGKQDQYAASYGEFRRYEFAQDGRVEKSEGFGIYFPFKTQADYLKRHLLLFGTHIQRSADTILTSQQKTDNTAVLLKIKALEEDFFNCMLIGGDIDNVGGILHDSWMLKRGLSDETSTTAIDEIYHRALGAGATGGKLLGAGGGGHFLFYVHPDEQESVKKKLEGLATHVPFRFEPEGSKVI